MRFHRKLALLVAAPVAAASLSFAAPAQASAGVDVCVVVGGVSLSAGIHLDPTISSSGTYTFTSTVMVCAGVHVQGLASVNSSGNYNNSGAIPTFTSTSLTTGTFNVSGNSCSGSVSGIRVGPVVEGNVSVGCGTHSGSGVVVLTFIPDPRTANTSNPTDPIIYNALMQGAAVLAATA